MLWSTRLFSVRYSKDLITRTVRVADVFGRVRLVVRVEISEEAMEPLQNQKEPSVVAVSMVWVRFSRCNK